MLVVAIEDMDENARAGSRIAGIVVVAVVDPESEAVERKDENAEENAGLGEHESQEEGLLCYSRRGRQETPANQTALYPSPSQNPAVFADFYTSESWL